MPDLPRPLITEEKKYLLAVERGDITTIKRSAKYIYSKQILVHNNPCTTLFISPNNIINLFRKSYD